MEQKVKRVGKKDLSFIGECFSEDLDINKRHKEKASADDSRINRLVQIFSTHSDEALIAYNAFDGDHFHLLQEMRKFTLNNLRVPANPESILGYKNVVSRYQNKYNVLLDDLAILQCCDELWVFTDCSGRLEDILKLPEGVLIEIAFFLKRRAAPSIIFIPITSIIKGIKPKYVELNISFEELEVALKKSDKAEIIDMANNDFKIDNDLKNLVFYISDPLDFKYAEWLRDGKYNAQDEIALVPGLASKISDLNPGYINIGRVILSWAMLLRKLSRKKAFYLDSIDDGRKPSLISEALKKYCIQLKGAGYLENKKWSSFNIPKIIQKSKWPITKFESRNI